MTIYTQDVESEEKFILYKQDDETGNTRGISIFKHELRIWGASTIEKYHSINAVSKNRWTTIYRVSSLGGA